MSFRIGQKVVCIKPIFPLEKGSVYTVNFVSFCDCANGIELREIALPAGFNGSICDCRKKITKNKSLWNDYRFRPLDETFADELEARIKEEMLCATSSL